MAFTPWQPFAHSNLYSNPNFEYVPEKAASQIYKRGSEDEDSETIDVPYQAGYYGFNREDDDGNYANPGANGPSLNMEGTLPTWLRNIKTYGPRIMSPEQFQRLSDAVDWSKFSGGKDFQRVAASTDEADQRLIDDYKKRIVTINAELEPAINKVNDAFREASGDSGSVIGSGFNFAKDLGKFAGTAYSLYGLAGLAGSLASGAAPSLSNVLNVGKMIPGPVGEVSSAANFGLNVADAIGSGATPDAPSTGLSDTFASDTNFVLGSFDLGPGEALDAATGIIGSAGPVDPNYVDPFAAPNPSDNPFGTDLTPANIDLGPTAPVFQTPPGVPNASTGEAGVAPNAWDKVTDQVVKKVVGDVAKEVAKPDGAPIIGGSAAPVTAAAQPDYSGLFSVTPNGFRLLDTEGNAVWDSGKLANVGYRPGIIGSKIGV